jgi:hypothetical protein
MRKSLWIILPVLLVAIGARNAIASPEDINFTGVVTCNDTTPCGGSSTFTVTGSYVYDPTTETLGAFSFLTPIGTIASSVVSSTFVGLFGGNFNLSFYGDFPGGVGSPSNSTYMNLAFPSSDTNALGSIVVGPFNFGSSVCQLASNGGCPTLDASALFPFTSGTATLAPTPEPGTSGLMLIGVGLLGLVMVMRKRIHLGHQQAT